METYHSQYIQNKVKKLTSKQRKALRIVYNEQNDSKKIMLRMKVLNIEKLIRF